MNSSLNETLNETLITHLAELERIILESGEPLEGNCVYLHNTLERSDHLLPKQENLMHLATKGNRIMEIGFNAGHSALMFLLGNPECHIQLFDIHAHLYSQGCFEYLDKMFPGRLTMIWGNTQETLLPYVTEVIHQRKTFDVIHVDGSHAIHDVRNDMDMCRFLSTEETLIIYDDVWLRDLEEYYRHLLNANIVRERPDIELKPTPVYTHTVCSFNKPTIAIASLAIGDEFRKVTTYSTVSKILYCARHHYDLVMDESVYDPSRPRAWSKIKLLQKYLHAYETLVWMDSDLYIMNEEIPLTNFGFDDMLVSRDWTMINTGVWFMKDTPFTNFFLGYIYDQNECIEHGNWEQTAFIKGYDENVMDAQSRIQVVYHTDFNAYWFNFRWGYFIIHFPGSRHLPALDQVMKTYCPVKRFDESQYAYQARRSWIQFEAYDIEMKKLERMNSVYKEI